MKSVQYNYKTKGTYIVQRAKNRYIRQQVHKTMGKTNEKLFTARHENCVVHDKTYERYMKTIEYTSMARSCLLFNVIGNRK